MKVIFSNLAYAKGLGGSLAGHMVYFNRHFYAAPKVQKRVLAQFRSIIDREKPDLCCVVEIDRGSFHSGYFNQIQALMCDNYCFHDIADKYGEKSLLSSMPLHRGKSNAFIARADYPFQRRYFKNGTKRLIHQISLPDNVTLFFAHFSLQEKVRALQFDEMHELVLQAGRDVMILADFNILRGFGELAPLLSDTGLRLLNREDEFTFNFHHRRLVLDLCLCTAELAKKVKLQVIPQPFSDHAALLVEW